MPLLPPNPDSPRREKIYLCGGPGTGKTTAALSAAFWSWKAGDPAKFYFLDFDDSLGDLLLDPRYKGIDNIIEIPVGPDWEDWTAAAEKAMQAQQGDWIVGDMIGRGWRVVQEWESRVARSSTRAADQLKAVQSGAKGWDLFRDINWVLCNAEFDQFIKPLLLRSRAHLFFTTEQKDLGAESRSNEPQSIKEARKEFGRYLPEGQKHIPFQMRSVLRIDRLARGRVLYTLKDRAREEMNGIDCPDFFQAYLKPNGWEITSSDA